MLLESLLKVEVADAVACGVVVQEAIESDALHRGYECAERCLWLQASAGADTDKCQRAVGIFLCAGVEVDIGEGVELVDYDIYIVGTYAVADTHYRFAGIRAAYGAKFARLHFKSAGIEKRCNHFHSTRVAYHDYTVGELFGQ